MALLFGQRREFAASRFVMHLACLPLPVLLVLLPISVEAGPPPIPVLTARVVDTAHILSPSTISFLTSKLQIFEQQTTNQIVVATIPDMKGYEIEDWGLAMLRGWGIGQKDKNNGVVLVVAPKDRQMRIEVGYGLEWKLPDATAYKIIQQEIIPRFKAGDFDRGVSDGVDAIIAAIGGTYHPRETEPGRLNGVFGMLQQFGGFAIFVVFFLIAAITNLRRRWDPDHRRYRWYWGGSRYHDSDDYGGSSGGFSGGGGGFSGGGGSGGGGGASGRW